MSTVRFFHPSVLVSALLSIALVGCSPGPANDTDSPGFPARETSTGQVRSASRICDEARRQIDTLAGGDEILLVACEAQPDGEGNVGLVFVLNDYTEWQSLLFTASTEDIVFTIPLALVTYAFAGSGEEPSVFDSILIVFQDQSRTVYDMSPSDLDNVLRAQTREDAESALLWLRERIRITSLD